MAQDFVVLSAYWGHQAFVPGPERSDPSQGPFNWIDMDVAIDTLCKSPYFSKLAQYGAGQVFLGNAGHGLAPDEPPSAWSNGTEQDGFTLGDIERFLTREIDAERLNRPDDWPGVVPIYVVVLQRWLYSKEHFQSAVGEHWRFSYHGAPANYAWNIQGASLHDTTKIVSHEIVEAIAMHFGAGEIADDCEHIYGNVGYADRRVMAQGYKSREDGDQCRLPGMA
jgi:hypothetical protein